MGSFSEEILGSDEALDAYYTYIDHYNRGKSHNEIMEALRHSSMPQLSFDFIVDRQELQIE